MFSSICPECGVEIPPQAKECVACNPLAASVDLMELEARAAKPKAYVAKPEPLLLTAATNEAPKAVIPARKQAEVPAPPAPRMPMPLALTGRTWKPAAKMVEAEAAVVATKLPAPISAVRGGPALAARQDYTTLAFSKLNPKTPNVKPKGASPEAQLSMPGPALPYELTSLNAAGIAKMLVSVGPWTAAAKPQSSSWLSTLVAAGVAATVLGGVFYAMPTLAGPTRAAAPPQAVTSEVAQPAKPVEPELPSDPLSKAIEVTGVRFVTGIPDRRPELHYLVVNHSNVALTGVVVNVTLRTETDSSAVAQFSFRTPRMNAFESKEMVSVVERVNSTNLPDWRRVKADIHILQ